MIQSFNGFTPRVHPQSYVHPTAVLIGDIVIHENVFIGPGAVLRGDLGPIIVGKGSNIQDNCVVHTFPNEKVQLGQNAHVGHSCVVHGAQLKDNCLIGIQSVLLDGAIIGAGSIVGACSLVLQNQKIDSEHLCYGKPARVIRRLTQEELNWKKNGTEVYHQLTSAYLDSSKDVGHTNLEFKHQRKK